MIDWPLSLVVPLGVFLASMLGTRFLIPLLTRQGAVDQPNARSSHHMPVPVGGGLAIVGSLFGAWIIMGVGLWSEGGAEGGLEGRVLILMAGLGLILAGVSWLDDLRGLGAVPRLAVHVLAVFLALCLLPLPGPVFGGWLPPVLDLIVAGALWIWFINLFNFMDGIDGLAGIETLAIATGLFVVSRKLGLGETAMITNLSIAAAAVGFLRWNWHPAKIFLGDVGSIPLGFVLGWLLLDMAARGAWAIALILPLYFLADATLTLVLRVVRGARFWEPHRQHFYQKAIDSGLRQDQVAWIIAIANMFLVMLSLVAVRGLPVAALLGAGAAIAVLLFLLVKGGPTD